MNRWAGPKALWCAAGLAAAVGAGCQSAKVVSETIAVVGVATGHITEEQAQAIVRSGEAIGAAAEQLTPENEYWIGRAVMATILSRYSPYDRTDLNRYVNLVGQSLALLSDRPETFGGYRFIVLDSDEINAFAAPGGLIAVTRGMLRLCRTEDELAAVLAHEIAHVNHRHGLQAIKKSRWTGAFTTVLVEAGKQLGGADLAEALRAFEGAIADVTQTLVNSGYSRTAEREADATAVRILRRAGYDPWALVTMLEAMARQLRAGGADFARTHPHPQERIREIRPLGPPSHAPMPRERQSRFEAAMANV